MSSCSLLLQPLQVHKRKQASYVHDGRQARLTMRMHIPLVPALCLSPRTHAFPKRCQMETCSAQHCTAMYSFGAKWINDGLRDRTNLHAPC